MMKVAELKNDWVEKRIKFVSTYNDESLPENTEPDLEIDYVEISDVDHVNGITNSQKLTFEKAPSRARRIVRKGDTIVSTVRTYLKSIAHIIEKYDSSVVSTGFAVIRPNANKEIHPKYLGYCFQDKRLIGDIVSHSVGVSYPAINASALVGLSIYHPPLLEQTQIASFLDKKTAQIDKLINEKEKLLKLLAEKRTAIITQAVTKGLDPNVEMKDSGIDWLGEIPKDWATKRLRFLVKTNPVKSEVHLEKDELVSFVPMEAVHEYGGITLELEKELNEVYNSYTYFKNGDVVVAKITPCFENGKGSIASGLKNDIAFGTTELHVLRPESKMNNEFLFYISISDSFRKIGESWMYGAGGQKRIPELFIKDLFIPICDIEEQERIAKWLMKKVDEIHTVSLQIEYSITALKEYREALITAAVTGQIDVRKEVVNE